MELKEVKLKKQIPKKINATNIDGTIKAVKPRAKKVAELDEQGNVIVLAPPVQKFTITHGDKSCIIKIGNMAFGIKIGDAGIESVMQHTESKDNENIRTVLTVMKTMKKANVSFAAIAARLTLATQSLPQTIKQFVNELQRPTPPKPVAVTAVVVVDTVETAAELNEHADDNHATPEHLHI